MESNKSVGANLDKNYKHLHIESFLFLFANKFSEVALKTFAISVLLIKNFFFTNTIQISKVKRRNKY